MNRKAIHIQATNPRQCAAGAQYSRRGNTIILVIGIITLLVMIATGYVTRTQGGRTSAVALQNAGLSRDSLELIVNSLATEISESLFVRPVDPPYFTGSAAPLFLPPPFDASNKPRLPIPNDGYRFQFDPAFPFNFAPYHVIPFTNWPDPDGVNALASDWPLDLIVNPGGPTVGPLVGEGNPFGNPGTGDTRWLRDLEPLRWDTNGDFIPDAFSHWRHMTYIARPNNAIRAIFDISDVGDANNDGFGRLITNLSIPIEQWLAIPHAYLNPATGDSFITTDFLAQWNNWMSWPSPSAGYPFAYRNSAQSPTGIPPNFLKLSDLNADGIRYNFGDRPEDEFNFGTARNAVSRVLADTDGDGYTDSFWYLVPGTVYNGIRQIVAVSIIDNSAMIDANVATRFQRANVSPTPVKTAGFSPSDLALMGELWDDGAANTFTNWNVGFYDNPDHHVMSATPPGVPIGGVEVDYDARLLDVDTPAQRHFLNLGFFLNTQVPSNSAPYAPTTRERLEFWNRSASRPLSSDPTSRYFPFGIEDELELRMFYGQNYPWLLSRFEHTVTNNNPALSAVNNILRNGLGREESSEFLDQLNNRMLVSDLRHRLTLYSAARNDIAPPWLWLYPYGADLDNDGTPFSIDQNDQEIFSFGQRKFDLRLAEGSVFFTDFNADFVIDPATERFVLDLAVPQTVQAFGLALRDRIERALMDDPYGTLTLPQEQTYYGGPGSEPQAYRLAAAYAANIREWRDRANSSDPYGDESAAIAHAVPVRGNPTTAFLGMEPQPFIVEAVVGHIYRAQPVEPPDYPGGTYINANRYVLLEDADRRSSMIVVQIANPYNRPVNLRNYRITAFGQILSLAALSPTPAQAPTWPWLAPGTADQPTTAIFFAMRDTIDVPSVEIHELKSQWRRFLDINRNGEDGAPNTADDDLTQNTMVIDVTGTWVADDRDVYDSYSASDGTIVIQRIDPDAVSWITVDRIDRAEFDDPATGANFDFRDAVNEMGDILTVIEPDPGLPPGVYIPPLPGDPYPGLDIGPVADGYNHWVQWVRYTRAWGVDVNRDYTYAENERNPRFVFADGMISKPTGANVIDGTYLSGTNGCKYRFDNVSDPDIATPSNVGWFTQVYRRADNLLADNTMQTNPSGVSVLVPFHKPFFFDLNRRQDFAWGGAGSPVWSYPDKGWYGQTTSSGGPATDPLDETWNETAVPPHPNFRVKYPMQMLHKDGDFEQVGELLNIFLFGHQLDLGSLNTTVTFSEFLTTAYETLTGNDVSVNRLRVRRDTSLATWDPTPDPNSRTGDGGHVVGAGDAGTVSDPRHAIPNLPAGVRLFDAFVCDGIGIAPTLDMNGDGSVNLLDRVGFGNAKYFDGTATAGQLNINTAPPEVLRSLPHWYRLVHETGLDWFNNQLFNAFGQELVTSGANPNALLPRVRLPEALVHYRERFNGGFDALNVVLTPFLTGYPAGPFYERRDTSFLPYYPGQANPSAGRSVLEPEMIQLRGDRGMASIGEITLLDQPGQGPSGYVDRITGGPADDRIYDQYWRRDMGAEPSSPDRFSARLAAKPFWSAPGSAGQQVSERVSTDRMDEFDWLNSNLTSSPVTVSRRPDTTAGDAEEQNMLFAGASNIITTRSDTFTVYFRVRSFRQNTSVSPPVWDATNRDYIVDDSRYVMLVDRSTVNRPSDKPKILYMEKLPN